ncbi:hypothetical protein QOZ80_9BG0718430 [Eleusine coracana subsp. coracana]|nr:hypothetical protein QOZ80_9BG0718430 [Eleusine coracana subsp. coracana]
MALLRSAARAHRLRQQLEQQGFLLPRISVEGFSPRFLGSSAPTEKHKCFPCSDPRSRNTSELKSNTNEEKEDILKRLSAKADRINDSLDKHSRLLQELELQIKNNNKSREIDLTPAAVLISASFLSFVLYKYVLG